MEKNERQPSFLEEPPNLDEPREFDDSSDPRGLLTMSEINDARIKANGNGKLFIQITKDMMAKKKRNAA